MRSKLLMIGAVAFVSFNAALALAAMPQTIGAKVVDKIMDWGDRHIGGPFKKGGGDEKATRAAISAIVMPEKAYDAFFNLTVKNGSETASPAQDTPGHSQQNGVPMPQGAHAQVPTNQPQTHQPEGPSQPPITVNPEFHTIPAHSPSDPRDHNGPLQPDLSLPAPIDPIDRTSHIAASDSPSSATAPSDSKSVSFSGHQGTQFVQQPDLVRTSEGHYEVAPESHASPAPAARPARASDHGGPAGHDGPMSGAHEIGTGRDKPDHNTPGGRDVSKVS